MTTVNSKITPEVYALYVAARKARDKAYSPYSKISVGAALRTSAGKIYTGCNIENASYGGTTCAEQVAIHKAISEDGKIEITEILVITDSDPPWPPCGICRQVLAEFGMPKTLIYVANLVGVGKVTQLSTLFPEAFTAKHVIG